MPELIAPTRRLRTAWLEAHAEWGPGVHEDGFGLLQTDNVDSLARFEAWVARLAEESGRCTYRWIMGDGHVTGGVALRHETHDLVARSGHIGFGIRTSARRCASLRGRWAGYSTKLKCWEWTRFSSCVRPETLPPRRRSGSGRRPGRP